jgi:hypothetical protein
MFIPCPSHTRLGLSLVNPIPTLRPIQSAIQKTFLQILQNENGPSSEDGPFVILYVVSFSN